MLSNSVKTTLGLLRQIFGHINFWKMKFLGLVICLISLELKTPTSQHLFDPPNPLRQLYYYFSISLF